MEAAIDPLLCHYQGPIGSLLRRDNMYSTDPSEVFTGLYNVLNFLCPVRLLVIKNIMSKFKNIQ